MFIANIDTPWITVIDGDDSFNTPKLPRDPAFEADIKEWSDVTGAEGAEVDVGGGEIRHLYGGNYAAVTGIQPDYANGRLGGSGDPDWLTIQVKVEDESVLQSIDAQDDYWVYWDEVEQEGEAARATAGYKPKDQQPPANEWGELRSKLARRGVPQWWIDLVLGTQRERTRGVHDFNMRQGYVLNQITPGPGAVIVDGWTSLGEYLVLEGWELVSFDLPTATVSNGQDEQSFTVLEVIQCDLDHLTSPLAQDIRNWREAVGYPCE